MKTTTIFPLGFATLLTTAHAAQMTDNFVNRPLITGITETLQANTTSATVESGEPGHGGARKRSVWAQWIAPSNGWVTLDSGGSFSAAIIAVYTGQSLQNLHSVARGAYTGTQTPAYAKFPVTQGTAYQIVLDGAYYSSSSSGIGQVNLRLTPEATPDSVTGTDQFQVRSTLNGYTAYGVGNNTDATLDPFQPKYTGSSNRDLWWEWTAPATGTVTLDTLESPTDTVLAVFSGAPANDPPWAELELVAKNEDVPNSKASQLSFQTEAGRTYQIAVGGQNTSSAAKGNIILKLNLAPNNNPGGIPGTDLFVNREELPGMPAIGVACNSHAGKEAFEPVPKSSGQASVWWSWTAPKTGPVEINTQGSAINTLLHVYTGADLPSLTEVAYNDNVPQGEWSRLVLAAEAGVTYQIRVDRSGSSSYDRGNIVLNLKPVPAPEIEVRQPITTLLRDGVSKRAFGNVRLGRQSARMTFVIRNTGTAPLTGLRVYRTGTQPNDFTVSPLGKSSLPPGEQMTFSITFKPKATGSRSARISVTSNDSDEGSFDIAVSGRCSRSKH